MKFIPHDYQQYAIQFLTEHPVAALLLDMGLGKTVTTLTAINELLFDRFEIRRVLVIAPLRVARDTWSAEIEKWEHLKHLKYRVAVGTSAERRQALHAKTDICILNRENISWLVEESGIPFDFDMLVIDELSGFKNHQDQDSRNAGGEFYICIQFAAFVGALAENAVHSYRRLSSHITCFHGSGIVLQNAGFVLFDVVDAADSNAVGVDVLGSVVRSQYAQNSVVLGNRISFFVGGSDHGSVLVDRSRSTGVID